VLGVRWAVLAIACNLGACRPAAPPPVVPIAAGAAPGFVARQKVVATVRGDTSAFDAVVQYRGDRLVVLALTPMGTKAFAIEQRGASISITPPEPRALPAPPEAILRDIHAAYFALPKAARVDGWHRTEAGGARWERWSQGRLHERVWGRRRDRQADRLRFVGGIAAADLPRELVFDHPRIGVRLEIHTIELRHGGT
jgi:hypothetical protein